MRTISLLLLLAGTFCLVSCNKEFDVQSPDVDAFVKMIKQGSYETKVGAELPAFTVSDVPQLLKYVDDMTEVPSFPNNPVSSIRLFSQIYLGEKILWVIQGISCGKRYASLGGFVVYKEGSERITIEELTTLLAEYKTVFCENSPHSYHLSNYIDRTPYRWR